MAKYILLKNDTSKKANEMEVYGVYLKLSEVPKVENTILITK